MLYRIDPTLAVITAAGQLLLHVVDVRPHVHVSNFYYRGNVVAYLRIYIEDVQ